MELTFNLEELFKQDVRGLNILEFSQYIEH
ncbi:hypothetical protein BABA_12395, partial [Neobacillus bataviensis LMG 21833]